MRNIVLLFSVSFISACSVTEKPEYFINDANLRMFQGGDELTYSVLDASLNNDSAGSYSVTFLERDEIAPDNTTSQLLVEEFNNTGNISISFLPHYYSQTSEGELILEAIGNAGEILWLLDDNQQTTGESFYPADINALQTNRNFTKKLQRCDEDNICEESGLYKLLNLQVQGIENVETAYANFETYKVNISVEISILDSEQAGNSKSYSFSGTQWVYPPLGVVKFLYDVNDFSGSSTLIGSLSSTNISIGAEFEVAQ